MELSGLIFVALALVWAVVLIPKALRHHDEVARTRSVSEVSDSARVLARREVVSEREARLVVPARSSAVATIPAPRTEAPALPSTPAAPGAPGAPATVPTPRRPHGQSVPAARRAAAAAAARRRRRILGVLVVASLVVGALSAAGVLLPWAAAVPAGMTLGYLVLARVLVRRERTAWAKVVAEHRAARAEPQPAAPAAVEVPAAPAVVEVPAAPAEPLQPAVPEQRNAQGLSVISGLEDTTSFPVGLLLDDEPAAEASALWDPLPVTLPTYVSKPRATRSVRTIDLSDPTISSSGRDASDSALVAEAATATAPPEGPAQAAVGS